MLEMYFAIADLDSNIQDYKKFCIEGNKLLVERIAKFEGPVVTITPSVSKCNFTSLASKKVSKKVARRASARKVTCKMNFQPRDDSETLTTVRKQGVAAESAGAFLRTHPKYRPEHQYLGTRPYCSSLKFIPSYSSKRKFPSQHHNFGRVLLDEQEFTMLERKICEAHKSKKRRHGSGLEPKKHPKHLISEMLGAPPN